jgi:IS30 family transposase
MAVPRRRLTVIDRTMIEVQLRGGWGIRAMALSLCRSPGTICNEIGRHGGVGGYLARAAQTQAAASRVLSGRRPRLARDVALFGEIARLLRLGWSPEQISGRRKRIEGGVGQGSGLQASHEAIYTAIYALPRGELRHELVPFFRQDQPRRDEAANSRTANAVACWSV